MTAGSLIEEKLEIVVRYSDGSEEVFNPLAPQVYPVSIEVRKTSRFVPDEELRR